MRNTRASRSNFGKATTARQSYLASEKQRLVNTSFSLFSNNCIAVHYYKDRKIQYKSPTMSLFMMCESYLSFLENLPRFLAVDLVDDTASRKQVVNFTAETVRNKMGRSFRYPIGSLGDGVTIHFNHDVSFTEARDKWNRRKARVKMDEIYVVMIELFGCCSETQLERFLRLPYPKVYFALHPIDHPDVVDLSRYKNPKEVTEANVNIVRSGGRRLFENFDMTAWLNARGTLSARDVMSGVKVPQP
jgi:uncharacterized protein (DUF1919 family)